METEMLRKELHDIIACGNTGLLVAMRETAKKFKEFGELSESELEELDRRRANYLSGERMSYTWEEAKEMIRQYRK